MVTKTDSITRNGARQRALAVATAKLAAAIARLAATQKVAASTRPIRSR